jgi:hypothetical protein
MEPFQKEVLEYHKKLTKADKLICEELFSSIVKTLPKATYKLWHGHPVWFLEGNPVVGYSKLKDAVRLLFWSGQSFDESGLEKEGSFKAADVRYADVTQIKKTDLVRWLKKAKAIQWDYKNIVARKGKLVRLV